MEKITNELQKYLNSMVDHVWLYMGRTVRVTGWKQKSQCIIIYNHGNDIRIPIENLESELNEFKSTSDGQLAKKTKMPVMWGDSASNIQKIEKTLMNNIDALDENPEQLEKAKAVQSQAKTVLDIQKFKLDVMKEMRKRGNV